ncbi:MAG: hypothetical protein ACXW1Z_14890 [Methylobacter sp.]
MLEGLFSILNQPVPPVPLLKKQRESLEPANYEAVPQVPPVPQEKIKTRTPSEIELNKIRIWLDRIGETDPVETENVLELCRTDPKEREKFLKDIQEGFILDETQDPDAPSTAVTPTESENEVLFVVCYIPSGIPIRIQANDAAHAEWLVRMNPKPKIK